MQKKSNKLLLKLCSVIILFIATTCTVFANSYQECYLEREEDGNYDIGDIDSKTIAVPSTFVDSVTEISSAVKKMPIKFRGRGIGCKLIPYGNATVHFMNRNPGSNIVSPYRTERGGVLLNTTVPGITYTVELLCEGCPMEVDLRLPPIDGDNLILDDVDWANTDKNWSLRFRFFITPEFKLKKGITGGNPVPGEIAEWYIGIETQAWIKFIVSADAFKFTVEQPTCDTVALVSENSVSGSTISLGNTPVSAIDDRGITAKVPFRIRGDHCAANKITVKLNAKNPASDATLVGKSSGSASGVAVKVFSDTDTNKEQLKANGSNASEFTYVNWTNDILYFPFTAQLVPDGSGSPVTPGSFSGNATFSFYYE